MIHRYRASYFARCGMAVAVLGTGSVSSATGQSAAPTDRPAERPRSCAVVGASVSSGLAWRRFEGYCPEPDPIQFAERQLGFELEEREYRLRTDNISLKEAFELLDGGLTVSDTSTPFVMHRTAHPQVGGQLRNTLRREPRLLLSLDLLLWFGFGVVQATPHDLTPEARAEHEATARLARQAQGFALCDEILKDRGATLVVADYPDLSRGHIAILPLETRPAPKVLAELNRRLYAWAEARPRVAVYPLAAVLARAERGELEVEVGGQPRRLRAEQVMQLDGMHPNRVGTAYLIQDIAAHVRRVAPDVADCLPTHTAFDHVLRVLGCSAGDLDYLAARATAADRARRR